MGHSITRLWSDEVRFITVKNPRFVLGIDASNLLSAFKFHFQFFNAATASTNCVYSFRNALARTVIFWRHDSAGPIDDVLIEVLVGGRSDCAAKRRSNTRVSRAVTSEGGVVDHGLSTGIL